MSREPLAKSQSRLGRSMMKEDIDRSKSVTLNMHGAESEDEGTNSMSLATTRKAYKKKERLK